MNKCFLIMLVTLIVLPMKLLSSAETFDGASLQKIDAISQADTSTQLLFFFDSEVNTPSDFKMTSPDLVVLDFDNARSELEVRKILIESTFVKSVRTAERVPTAEREGRLRAMIALKQGAKYQIQVSGANVYVSFSKPHSSSGAVEGKPQEKAASEKSDLHQHGDRSHSHSLPEVGVQHRHGEGPVGQYSLSSKDNVPSEVKYYKVTGVGSWDTLNVRSRPTAKSAIIDELPSDGKGITSGGEENIRGRYIKISYKGVSGWVNKRYLQIDP